MTDEDEVIPLPPQQVATLDKLWPPTGSRYASAAVSENTRRAYRSDLTHFLRWGGSLPSSPDQVISYLEDHAQSLSISTLRRRIATLNEAHRLLLVDSPADTTQVRRVLRGIARTEGRPQKKAPPLLLEQACRLIQHLDGSVAGIRDKAMILTGWALFLRRSELVSFDREDLRFQKDRALLVLRKGKTDQEGISNTMALPRLGGPACPVAAMELWLQISGITSGPLFRRVFRGGKVGTADQRLTAHSVNLVIKRRAFEAGVDEALLFSGHSLRRGGITQAYAAQQNEADIQRVSRHRSLLQLRDYRDMSAALAGDQPSQDFLMALNEQLLSATSL